MFVIILYVLLGGLFVASLAALKWADENNEGFVGIPAIVTGLTAFGFVIALTVTWPIVYYISVNDAAKLEAFYHDTLSAYEYTVTATGQVEITEASPGILDIAYQGQGQAASERVKELRDKVDWYNGQLRKFSRFNDTWIADPFLVDLPEDLLPITLGGQEPQP